MKTARVSLYFISLLLFLSSFPFFLHAQEIRIEDGGLAQIMSGNCSNTFSSSTGSNASTAMVRIGGGGAATASLTGDFSAYFGSVSFYNGSILTFNPLNASCPAKFTIAGMDAATMFIKSGAALSLTGDDGNATFNLGPFGVLDLTDASNSGDLTLGKGILITVYSNANAGQIKFRLSTTAQHKIICSNGGIFTDDPLNGQIDVSRHFLFDFAGTIGTAGESHSFLVAHVQSEPFLTGSPNVVNAGEWSHFSISKVPQAGGWDIVFSAIYMAPVRVLAETMPDGTGTEVPAQDLAAGDSIVVYSVLRDNDGHFVGNIAAGAWTLEDKTGGVADGDLVPGSDMKSAVFTGHLVGTTWIKAVYDTLVPVGSGVITVVPGAMSSFALELGPCQMNGEAFGGTNTLTALDAFGNTVPDFDASANHVTVSTDPDNGTITGLGSLNNNVLDQAGDFVGGIAGLTGKITFTGTAGDHTFSAHSATGNYSGTSGMVTLNSAPSGDAYQVFCYEATIADLVVSGSDVLWYADSSGGTALPPETEIVDGDKYFASQTISGCEGTARFKVAVTVYPYFDAGSIAFSGESICAGGDPQVILGTIPASGGDGNYTYRWQSSLTADFSVPADIIHNDAEYDPPSGLTETTWFRRLAKDGICNASWMPSGEVWKVTVLPLPVPVIQGSSETCLGSGTLFTTEPGMTGYWWTASNGGVVETMPAPFDYAAVITWDQSGNQEVTLNYADDNGCMADNVSTLPVLVHVLPVIPLYGATEACLGTSETYSTTPGMTHYQWSVSTGGTVISGGGTGQHSITVRWDTSGDQAVSVNYSDLNGCRADSSAALTVRVFPLPVPEIAGPASACLNSADNVYTTAPGMNNYSWTVSPGGMVTAGGGASDNSLNVSWLNSGNQEVGVSYSDTNGCSAQNPVVFSITVFDPLLAGTATGDQLVCSNFLPAQLNASFPSGGSGSYAYRWFSFDNVSMEWHPLAGAVTPLYQPGMLSQTVQYKLAQIDLVCQDTVFTNPVTVSVYAPLLAGMAQGDQVICHGSVPSLLTSVAPAGGSGSYGYQWLMYDSGLQDFIPVPGAAGTTWQPDSLTQTTIFKLAQYDQLCQDTVLTNAVTIGVYAPLTAGTAGEDQFICFNTEPEMIATSQPGGGSGNYSYQWQFSPDQLSWTDIPGADSPGYSPGPLTETAYYRLLTGDSDCPGQVMATNAVAITVAPLLTAEAGPDLMINIGNTAQLNATASGGVTPYHYSWSPASGLSDPMISNPSAQPAVTTNYSLTVTDSLGCTATDALMLMVVPLGATVSGTVAYDNYLSSPMENVVVTLGNDTAQIMSTITDGSGYYQFSDVLPGTYTIDGTTDMTWGGVNSNDALLIMKHFVNLIQLSGLRILAADVNSSGTVNATDALVTANRFIHLINAFPAGDWLFEQGNVTVHSPLDSITHDFRALCYGDVNGSQIPSGARISSGIALSLSGQIEACPGQVIDLPVNLESPLAIGAVSLILNIPENLSVVEVKLKDRASADLNWHMEDGILRISWYNVEPIRLVAGEPLVILRVRVTNFSDEISLSIDPSSELGDADANVIQGVRLTMPQLRTLANDFAFSIFPNPSNSSSEIVYVLSEPARVRLTLYNMIGAEVQVITNEDKQAGTYSANLDVTRLLAGTYYVKMEASGLRRSYIATQNLYVIH